jgi:hypothetical protein
MRPLAYRISLAVLVCACTLKVHAEITQEKLADVITQAAEAWERAREAKWARLDKEAREAQERFENDVRMKEQWAKEEELRRQKEAAAVRKWPGLGGLMPPLEPDEAYGETSNGCGIVLAMQGRKTFKAVKFDDNGKMVLDAAGKAALDEVSPQEFLRRMVWTGDCPAGLAHGLGAFMTREHLVSTIDYKTEFSYGRRLTRSLQPGRSPGARHVGYLLPGNLNISIPAWRDPFVPRFGKWTDDAASTQISVIRSNEGVKSTFIYAEMIPCTLLDKKPRGCSGEKRFDVPAISVTSFQGQEHQTIRTQCPDLGDGKNCAALWQQIAGPLIAEIQPLMAKADADDEARRKRYTALNSMHVLNARVMQMAREAQAEKDIARRKAAAAEGEADAKKKREASEAEQLAKQQQAERDFKAQLTRLNAGQLYVMADELKTAGKSAQARDVLRALITRFPDHALAGNAANMLATLK